MHLKITLLFVFSISFSVLGISQDYWELIETPDSSFVRSFEINQEGTLFLGMSGGSDPGGIFKSLNEGQSWEYYGLIGNTIYSIEFDINGDIYCGFQHGIYKSSDDGLSWEQVFNDIMNITVLESYENGYLFAGGPGNIQGILRSKDFGQTWDTCYVFTNYGQEDLRAIDFSSDGTIYAGTGNTFGPGGLYKSCNYGDTWEVLDVPALNVLGIGIHPSGDIFAGSNSTGLYRYHYNTQQWSHDLFNIGPRDFLFFGNDTIYVGCSDNPTFTPGILFSTDNGLTYNWSNSGMLGNGSSVRELLVDPSGYIYVCGGFIYRSSDPIYTNNDKYYAIQEFTTQCIPNPFKNKTKITWQPKNSNNSVNLKIRDLSGKTVINTFIDNNGEYTFLSHNLNGGMYFYTITGQNTFYSGKMVLKN